MSAQELHDLFVKFSNFGDIHDFSQVWNEVKSLFKDDHKQNVNQYEIPEILKDLPLVNEEQSDAKLLNELMELDSTESNDMAGELGNTFRRLEIVQIDHVNSQVKFFEFAPTTYTYDGFSFSDVHEKFELDADIFTFQPYQSDDVNITAWKVSQEKQVIFDDAPKIPEIVAIIEEVAPIIEEVAPIVEEVAPIVEEVVPVVQNDKPIFPLVVIPAAENVVAQEKARLPYKVFNVHPDRGPFQSDTVYLLRGIDPREAPQMNHKHGKMSASMEITHEDKISVEPAILSPVVPVAQPRPKFAISAEQFAKQKQLIQEKASKESVEEIPESTQQQAEVETFVSELVEDKSKVEAPQIEAVIPQRPKFAISAEQFAKQKQLIQEKATKESVEETPESTQQQTEVETFVSELVEDESNTRESLTVEEKQAVDAFVSEIINEQSNDVTSFTPPPLPPPLPVSTKVTKTWAPVETATGETSKKQEPKATKTVFAISANEFVTGAKQLKRVTVEKHSAEKGKDSGDGVKNLLFKAMENVSARTEGGKYSAKHVDEEDADIDNFWENEEKEEALIATNTALIRETISQKLNSVSFQEKLSIDLQELVRSKSPVIKTAIELYHARLSADIKVDSEKSIKIESKISEMLEKIDLLIKQQLTSHGDKSSKSYYAENMAELLVHKINLKESIEASVVEKLLAQFDHDLQVKMYDKVKIEMGTILSEETKYLSKTEGLNTSESYSKFAVDQLSKNLMADKDVIKDIVHDGDDQSVESKPVDTQPIQSSLAAALQLRRVGIADDQEEDEEDSDWEDEDPTSQSLPISQEKVVVKEFAKSMVDHKSEDVANGALETKKSSTVLSTQEIAEVESFVKDITKKGSSLSMADMIQSPDEIPGLQEGGGSIIEGKQDISSFQPVAVCNAVMMQQEVLPQVALAHFE
ncbi:MAG: hypothetical protein HYX61_00635 [Gammaproteobacteria bacterium]|nr:hypothetical protein [Gammaproteobacteria bacterium]